MLSIVVPAIGGRIKRLKAMISRFTLNQHLYPDIPFELIVVDGSECADYQELCEFVIGNGYLKLKYINVPYCGFINATAPRNVGIRCAQGKVLAMLDIDHWPSEHLIYGAMKPFIDGKTVLNKGYMIDTNKSRNFGGINDVCLEKSEVLLQHDQLGRPIMEIFEEMKIPKPHIDGHVWLQCAPLENVHAINAYDEMYCRSYSRDEDDYFYRLAKQLPVHKEEYKTFNGLHVFHKAAWRSQKSNKLNKEYYKRMGENNPRSIVRNKGWPWGRMIKYSFAIIDGKILGTKEFEQWIADNVPGVEAYLEEPEWASLEVFMKELEKRA